MMQAGAGGARECDHVMVAAVRAVHEGDIPSDESERRRPSTSR
jgi:hypothetical protein